jgi:hypothetical protein
MKNDLKDFAGSDLVKDIRKMMETSEQEKAKEVVEEQGKMKQLDEETEEITEISQKLKSSYVQKAVTAHGHYNMAARHAKGADKEEFKRKETNTKKGISRALASEETQVDERAADTEFGAGSSMASGASTGSSHALVHRKTGQVVKKFGNVSQALAAHSKMPDNKNYLVKPMSTFEEVEIEETQVDEINKSTYVNAIRKATDPDAEKASDTEKIINRASKYQGQKFAKDLEGMEKSHFGRPNHVSGTDPLSKRTMKSTVASNVTTSGKLKKNVVKGLKTSFTEENMKNYAYYVESYLEEEGIESLSQIVDEDLQFAMDIIEMAYQEQVDSFDQLDELSVATLIRAKASAKRKVAKADDAGDEAEIMKRSGQAAKFDSAAKKKFQNK